MKAIFAEIDLRFTSGNGVPVERAALRAEEWQRIKSVLSDLCLHDSAFGAVCTRQRGHSGAHGTQQSSWITMTWVEEPEPIRFLPGHVVRLSEVAGSENV